MFCSQCGVARDASARFCSNCGAAVSAGPEGASVGADAGAGGWSAVPPAGADAASSAAGYSTQGYPASGYAGAVGYASAGYPAGTLMRLRHPRMIAGVCSGIAAHYGWDLTLVRMVLVLSVLTVGFGIGLYLILWVVIPEAPYALMSPMGTNPGGPAI